ncbi:MAG: hypothetical protein KKA28_16085 [Planctomycetes bacterium]|nr:hypothetical protein [Planctomycetota bacterium]MCG2685457.1 hypothetical protein [Planctomycetales bacterium]
MSAAEGNRFIRLMAACLVWVVLSTAGCATTSKLMRKLPGPVGQSARDELLRSEVESDDFPSAKQAGV